MDGKYNASEAIKLFFNLMSGHIKYFPVTKQLISTSVIRVYLWLGSRRANVTKCLFSGNSIIKMGYTGTPCQNFQNLTLECHASVVYLNYYTFQNNNTNSSFKSKWPIFTLSFSDVKQSDRTDRVQNPKADKTNDIFF